MNEIPRILEKTEKVIWEGKPRYTPYMLSFIIAGFIVAFVFSILRFSEAGQLPAWLQNNAHFIGMVLGILLILYGHLSYRVTYYAVTDKRVILQSGVIGRDFKSIDYDKMQNVSVNVGPVDVAFKTGSIKMFSGEIEGAMSTTTHRGREEAYGRIGPKYDVFKHITDPYGVLKAIQELLSSKKEASADVLRSIEEILRRKL